MKTINQNAQFIFIGINLKYTHKFDITITILTFEIVIFFSEDRPN